MNFLFSTGSLWTYSTERAFDFAARAGFDGVELMIDRRWETRQPDFLRRLIDQHGLPVGAIHSPFMPGIPGWPEDQVQRLRLSVELAGAIGAQTVVHHPPTRYGNVWLQVGRRFVPLPVPGWRPQAAYKRWLLEAYAAYQAETAVALCIENMPALERFGRRFQWFVWGHHTEIGRFPQITLDTTHLGTWGHEPVDVYPMLREKVGHIHLSNYDGREHLRPETGQLALDRFVARLAADGYAGQVTLELHPQALDAGQPDEQVVARMAHSLACCREWAKKGVGTAAAIG